MDLRTLIAEEASEIDRVMRADIADLVLNLDPLLTEILEYGLFGGGKRVRPLLAVLSARLCGNSDTAVYRLATAFEYLHAATLFHDDVIDRAESRRGRTSVNKRYGGVGAILAGDFLHAHSMEIIGSFGGIEALGVFSEATRGMVDGEFMQLRNVTNFQQSEKHYFSVVMGKTALLIGSACEIGSMYGGADQVRRNALKSYGINLGCAFQIVDDLLDYQGDQQKTGKAIGNDLAEGKMTLPLILAMQRAETTDRQRLLAILNQERNRVEHLSEVISLIEKYHGFSDARKKAEKIIAEALVELTIFTEQKESRSFKMLDGLTHYVLSRNH